MTAPNRFFDKSYNESSTYNPGANKAEQINEHPDKVAFRTGIGTAFRKNRFKITLKVNENSGSHVFYKIITGSTKTENPLYFVKGTSRIFEEDFPNFKEFFDKKSLTWTNQFVAIQTPSYTVQMSENVVQFSKYAIGGDRGSLTLDLLNDQWNFGRQFWDSYLKLTAYKHLVEYFDNLKFDIILDVYNNNMQPFFSHKFKDCIAYNVQEEEFNWANASAQPIVRLDIDYKKHEIIYSSNSTLKGGITEHSIPWKIQNKNLTASSELGTDQSNLYSNLGFKPGVTLIGHGPYPFTAYFTAIKNADKTIRTVQNFMTLGSAVLPLVGEIGRYLPLGVVVQMATAMVLKGHYATAPAVPQIAVGESKSLIGSIGSSNGYGAASSEYLKKVTIDPSFLTGGNWMDIISKLSDGTALSMSVTSLLNWVRSAIHQGENLGGVGAAPNKATVRKLDLENQFLLAKFYPLTPLNSAFRATTDGLDPTDNKAEWGIIAEMNTKDARSGGGTGGTLAFDAVTPARKLSMRNDVGGYAYIKSYRTESDTLPSSPGKSKVVDLSEDRVSGKFQKNSTDGGLTKWKRSSYGAIENSVDVGGLTEDDSKKLYELKIFNPSIIEGVTVPSSDVADGGLESRKKTTWQNSSIIDVTIPSSVKADGGVKTWKKETYGSLADNKQKLSEASFNLPNPIGTGSATDSILKQLGLYIPDRLGVDGGLSKWRKKDYGVISDSDMIAKSTLSKITFISKSDIGNGIAQIAEVTNHYPLSPSDSVSADGGLNKWKKENYGVIPSADVVAKTNLSDVIFIVDNPYPSIPDDSKTADGGLNDWKKRTYGVIPIADIAAKTTLSKIIFISDSEIGGGTAELTEKINHYPLVPDSSVDADGGTKSFIKTTYGEIVDNEKSMSDVKFITPADELKIKQQARSLIDEGIGFWKKQNYGPIDNSSYNAYQNDEIENPNLGQVSFDSLIPLENAPLEMNDPNTISEIKNALASIFVYRDMKGKLIINDLSNPSVKNAVYLKFIEQMMKIIQRPSKNDANVVGNEVRDNISTNDAKILMAAVDNALKNQNSTTRNTIPLENNSINKASITIIDKDNSNSKETRDGLPFDLNALQKDKKILLQVEMNRFKNVIDNTFLRPLGVVVDASKNEASETLRPLKSPDSEEKPNLTSSQTNRPLEVPESNERPIGVNPLLSKKVKKQNTSSLSANDISNQHDTYAHDNVTGLKSTDANSQLTKTIVDLPSASSDLNSLEKTFDLNANENASSSESENRIQDGYKLKNDSRSSASSDENKIQSNYDLSASQNNSRVIDRSRDLDSNVDNSSFTQEKPITGYSLDSYVRTDGVKPDKSRLETPHKDESIAESASLTSYRKKVSDSSNPNSDGEIQTDTLARYRKMVDEGYTEKQDGQTSSKKESC